MPMERKQWRERSKHALQPLQRPGKRCRREAAPGHPAGHKICEPGEERETFDREIWIELLEALPIAYEHHPRQRLIRVHHRMLLSERPVARVVDVGLGMKIPKEESSERRVCHLDHRDHATGNQRALRLAEECRYVG